MKLHFPNMSTQTFLDEYWQQKPLLFKQALPEFSSPLLKEELAGLSCEESIESRIIIEKTCERSGRTTSEYELLHGPFDENDFSTLPKSHWTLLVQAVDHWVPEVSELLKYFDFIPNWRLDDIMISYATKGGNVGPHYDLYDVFLLQGAGTREWRVGQFCDENTKLASHPSLKILENFEETDRWILEPGDMLYLPPQVAHHGIACDDECITLSVGHRAPSHKEILHHFSDYVTEDLSDFLRYQDPGLKLQTNSGEISDLAIQQVQNILLKLINNKTAVKDWFGAYVTEPKYEIDQDTTSLTIDELKQEILEGATILKTEGSRLCYIEAEDAITLYADGATHHTESPNKALSHLVKDICDRANLSITLDHEALENKEFLALVQALINNGSLYLE